MFQGVLRGYQGITRGSPGVLGVIVKCFKHHTNSAPHRYPVISVVLPGGFRGVSRSSQGFSGISEGLKGARGVPGEFRRSQGLTGSFRGVPWDFQVVSGACVGVPGDFRGVQVISGEFEGF